MTAEQEQALRALGQDIAGAEASPWEPRVLMEAFRSEAAGELHLTMQTWANLEALRSPLLQGELPESAEELADAVQAFGGDLDGLTPEEGLALARAMRRACQRGFAMTLRMEPPERGAAPAEDGFGAWAPIWACLVTQCGLDPHVALALRVDRAQVLIATHRRNQGWQVAGTPYALRDLEQEVARG